MALESIDEWIQGVEKARAGSSLAGRRFFALPEAVREPTEEERRAAAMIALQESARRRAKYERERRQHTGQSR